MLSESELYKAVPKDPEGNRRHRRNVLEACKNNPAMQQRMRQACKRDILFYISTFVWKYNTQPFDNEIGPFIPWPVQEKAIKKILWCIENRKDLRMAKSREMGASWMCLIVMDWLYQFHGNKKFLMISRNKEAVDAVDDSDSLFWKIDFIHARLPSWLRPDERRKRYAFKKVGDEAGITGQASTECSGAGGRAAAVFVDEFSKIFDGFGERSQISSQPKDSSGADKRSNQKTSKNFASSSTRLNKP